MNWKFGGEYKQGLFTYQVNIKRQNRPTLIQEPYGTCKGTWYPFELSSVYKLKGKFNNQPLPRQVGSVSPVHGSIPISRTGKGRKN